MSETIRCMAWNVGFSSRKDEFLSDERRAFEILNIVERCDAKVIALDEMASRKYTNGMSFDLEDYIRSKDTARQIVHFEPALSLGRRHSNPYGKLPELRNKFGISHQEQGLGIWIRHPLSLRNLFSLDQGDARVELVRPLPHPLYMGTRPSDEKRYSAGRDEEDRPVLFARIGTDENNTKKIYFASLHLPTLKNEENDPPETTFSSRQEEILKMTLRLSRATVRNVDELGSELRVYMLRHLTSHAERIEEYWGNNADCVFILAGDFNFEHTKQPPTLEHQVLEQADFEAAKTEGFTRPGDRLFDNIWVKGAVATEVLFDGRSAEYVDRTTLDTVSDHYPVVADIMWE